MRKLTIKREKSFIGCLIKLKVYIEDAENDQLTINGTPCRLLGTVANNREAVFEIGEQSAKVYVIADKMSKEYCNDCRNIPKGTEDVSLSGKCCPNASTGNAFCFYGEPDKEALENRRQNEKNGKKKTAVIFAVSFAVIIFVALCLTFIDNTPNFKATKDFLSLEMSIKLNGDFFERENVEFDFYAESPRMIVAAMREQKTDLVGYGVFKSLAEANVRDYAKATIEFCDTAESLSLKEKDGLIYYDYKYTNVKEYHTYDFVYENEDAFWLVQFIFLEDNIKKDEKSVFEFAKTVTVEE